MTESDLWKREKEITYKFIVIKKLDIESSKRRQSFDLRLSKRLVRLGEANEELHRGTPYHYFQVRLGVF